MNQAVVVYGIAAAVAALVLYGALRAFWRRPGSAQEPAFGPPPPDISVVGRTRIGIGRSLVLVDVQGRRHGRGHDQSLDQHEGDEPAHDAVYYGGSAGRRVGTSAVR